MIRWKGTDGEWTNVTKNNNHNAKCVHWLSQERVCVGLKVRDIFLEYQDNQVTRSEIAIIITSSWNEEQNNSFQFYSKTDWYKYFHIIIDNI